MKIYSYRAHLIFVYICLFVCLSIYTHVCVHRQAAWYTHRGQRTTRGSQFLLLPCGSWGLISSHEAWQQGPLPAKSSLWPLRQGNFEFSIQSKICAMGPCFNCLSPPAPASRDMLVVSHRGEFTEA